MIFINLIFLIVTVVPIIMGDLEGSHNQQDVVHCGLSTPVSCSRFHVCLVRISLLEWMRAYPTNAQSGELVTFYLHFRSYYVD